MAEEGCFRLRGQRELRPERGHVSGGAEAGEPGAGGVRGRSGGLGRRVTRGLSYRACEPQARPFRLLNDGKQLEGLNDSRLSFASASPRPQSVCSSPHLFLDKKQKHTD